jgi:hypothetical protein
MALASSSPRSDTRGSFANGERHRFTHLSPLVKVAVAGW